MKRTFMVEVDVPSNVPIRDLKDYIQEAVDYWGGQCHPDDWRFGGHDTKVEHLVPGGRRERVRSAK